MYHKKSSSQVTNRGIAGKGTHVMLILTMRIILDLAYMKIISPYWAYSGFVWKPNFIKIVESYIMTLLLAVLSPHLVKRASDYLVTLLLIIPIIPCLSLYGLRDDPRIYTYMIVICFIIVLRVRQWRIRTFLPVRNGPMFGLAICLFLLVLSLTERLLMGRLQYFNLDLRKVYDFRSLLSETTSTHAFSYVHTWAEKIASPMLISWSLYIRRRWFLILLLGVQILLFATSAAKAVLFYPVLVIVAFQIFSKQRYPIHLTIIGVIFVIIICSMAVFISGNLLPASLFIRRTMFVPSSLNYAYYKVFSDIGHVYMSNSVLGGILSYPFDYGPTHLVSWYTKGHTDTWMNTGFLGTGYMHFGFIGMVIFSAIIGFLISLVDSLSIKRIPLPLVIILTITPFRTVFVSSDLPTALLTHGIALCIMLLWLFGSSHLTDG